MALSVTQPVRDVVPSLKLRFLKLSSPVTFSACTSYPPFTQIEFADTLVTLTLAQYVRDVVRSLRPSH